MNQTTPCLRCKTTMEAGYLPDATQGGYLQDQWAGGTPEKSFWTGLKINRKEMLPVITLRCPSCGYLESYALPPETQP